KRDDDDDPGFPANRDGWVRALTDIGLSFDFVSSPEIESGALDPRRFKVVILPLSLAVSAKEAQALEAFARAGGTVIADGAAGVMDEHCAWRPAGALNGLFGLRAPSSLTGRERPAGEVRPTPEGKAWGLEAAGLGAAAPFEAEVVAGEGRPLVTIAGTPAVFTRPIGKGTAIYLNTLLDRYPQLRKARFGGGATRSLLSALLAHAAVRPAVRLRDVNGKEVGPTRIARYRFGDAEIIGLLPEPVDIEELHGRDGVRSYDDSKLGNVVAQEVEIGLPRAASLVNVRTGEYLGSTDRWRTSLIAGDAMFVAMGQVRPAISLSGPPSAKRGDHVRFEIRLTPPSAKRLVRCHVYGPDGLLRPEYARNLLADGPVVTFVLPTALDDEPGAYRLKVADVVGGDAAESVVDLR
ncbi:MAG: beta-galactosidase trimerization domain-containing protein, partial [Vicinamibacteria bacterium]